MGPENVKHRLHQTPLSRTVRKLPGIRSVAMRWWLSSQGKSFKSAFEGVSAPVTPFDHSRVLVDVPTVEDIRSHDARTVARGEEFSAEMARWCSTSKFQTLGYQDVYGRVLSHLREASPRVIEVGIGVNDPNAPSGMEAGHRPGASLVGWANYFPGGDIHGADVDPRVLVDTDIYRTHFVDQRDACALADLAAEIGAPLDLVVDDGLHTAEANALTVAALLPLLSSHGVLVVEDILEEYDPLWHGLSSWLRREYRVTFFSNKDLRSYREGGLAVFWRAA